MTLDINGERPEEIDEATWQGLRRIMRAKPVSRPTKQPAVCPHRGECVRLVECPSCNGLVYVKVFACAKHGECTVSKAIAGIHVCDG